MEPKPETQEKSIPEVVYAKLQTVAMLKEVAKTYKQNVLLSDTDKLAKRSIQKRIQTTMIDLEKNYGGLTIKIMEKYAQPWRVDPIERSIQFDTPDQFWKRNMESERFNLNRLPYGNQLKIFEEEIHQMNRRIWSFERTIERQYNRMIRSQIEITRNSLRRKVEEFEAKIVQNRRVVEEKEKKLALLTTKFL